MAKEDVKKFSEEVLANKELQEKIMAAQKGYETEGKSEEEIFEDILLPIAKESGFEFTISEYKSAQRGAMAGKGISEEELENVSGGGWNCFIFGESIGICVGPGVEHQEEDSHGIYVCVVLGFGLPI